MAGKSKEKNWFSEVDENDLLREAKRDGVGKRIDGMNHRLG